MTAHRCYETRVNPTPPYECGECGKTWDDSKGRWIDPKTPEGKARAEAWMAGRTAE